MSKEPSKFELPKTIERHLAALSRLYAKEGKRQLQEIIVNIQQTRFVEEWTTDNYYGVNYGHRLYLVLPEPIFLNAINQKNEIQTQIEKDLNKIHNVENEFIEEVFMESEAIDDPEWRKNSGLLLTGKRSIPPEATKRIWGDQGFRVFLSHKDEVKKETADLKEQLRLFGISCFVAHKDIQATTEWLDEIENALASMDGFVALMTDTFHESNWTDQEVGYAFARGVPIIAVRLGKDPYGFIGKFQGLSTTWARAAEDIIKIFIKNDKMFSAYVEALRKCSNYEIGNTLAKALPGIAQLTNSQVDELVAAYNETDELRSSFVFNGKNPLYYGYGLVHRLNRLGPRQFKFTPKRLIEQES